MLLSNTYYHISHLKSSHTKCDETICFDIFCISLTSWGFVMRQHGVVRLVIRMLLWQFGLVGCRGSSSYATSIQFKIIRCAIYVGAHASWSFKYLEPALWLRQFAIFPSLQFNSTSKSGKTKDEGLVINCWATSFNCLVSLRMLAAASSLKSNLSRDNLDSLSKCGCDRPEW